MRRPQLSFALYKQDVVQLKNIRELIGKRSGKTPSYGFCLRLAIRAFVRNQEMDGLLLTMAEESKVSSWVTGKVDKELVAMRLSVMLGEVEVKKLKEVRDWLLPALHAKATASALVRIILRSVPTSLFITRYYREVLLDDFRRKENESSRRITRRSSGRKPKT